MPAKIRRTYSVNHSINFGCRIGTSARCRFLLKNYARMLLHLESGLRSGYRGLRHKNRSVCGVFVRKMNSEGCNGLPKDFTYEKAERRVIAHGKDFTTTPYKITKKRTGFVRLRSSRTQPSANVMYPITEGSGHLKAIGTLFLKRLHRDFGFSPFSDSPSMVKVFTGFLQ